MTQPFHESRLCWIPDPTPSPPRRVEQKFPVPPSDSSTPIPSDSVRSRNSNVSVRKNSDNQASAISTSGSSGAPLTPYLSLGNAGEGEGDRLAEQPIRIGHPVQLPQ